MLETPEARAKLRRKLETWPDDRKSPVTINQGLELLDIVERLEKEKKAEWRSGQLILGENSRLGAKADYLEFANKQLKEKIEKLTDICYGALGKSELLEKEADMLACFCAVLCPNVPYHINCQSCDNCPGGIDCKNSNKPEAWRELAKKWRKIQMVKENIDINEYPEPKGNSQYNEFVGIIFKNNLAMVKSCNVLFDENKRLKETIDKLIDIRDSVVSKYEQLEKEADWLIDEIIMSESKKCPLCDCPQKAPDSPTESESIAFLNGCRKCWRRAAQIAVEQQNERR